MKKEMPVLTHIIGPSQSGKTNTAITAISKSKGGAVLILDPNNEYQHLPIKSRQLVTGTKAFNTDFKISLKRKAKSVWIITDANSFLDLIKNNPLYNLTLIVELGAINERWGADGKKIAEFINTAQGSFRHHEISLFLIRDTLPANRSEYMYATRIILTSSGDRLYQTIEKKLHPNMVIFHETFFQNIPKEESPLLILRALGKSSKLIINTEGNIDKGGNASYFYQLYPLEHVLFNIQPIKKTAAL